MGQFHSDFELKVPVIEKGKEIEKNCENIVAVESIFLGKKSYIDKLEGDHPKEKDVKVYGYHIRMKGIPNESILFKAEQKKKNPLELYEMLYKSEEFEFDLIACHPKFIFHNNYTISSRSVFKRKAKF